MFVPSKILNLMVARVCK